MLSKSSRSAVTRTGSMGRKENQPRPKTVFHGINLAYAELYLTVAALVSRFDMELLDFDRARDLGVVRDKFIGMPSREARSVRFRFRPRRF